MENCYSNLFDQILKKRENNLTERNKTIPNDDELCRVFNNFFLETVDELKILKISRHKLLNANNSLKEALKYFENHPSVTNIKSKGF